MPLTFLRRRSEGTSRGSMRDLMSLKTSKKSHLVSSCSTSRRVLWPAKFCLSEMLMRELRRSEVRRKPSSEIIAKQPETSSHPKSTWVEKHTILKSSRRQVMVLVIALHHLIKQKSWCAEAFKGTKWALFKRSGREMRLKDAIRAPNLESRLQGFRWSREFRLVKDQWWLRIRIPTTEQACNSELRFLQRYHILWTNGSGETNNNIT